MMRSSKVSPENSIPSLSASTVASTNATEDMVVRELFPVDVDHHKLGQSALLIEVDRESLFGSDISVASVGTYFSIDDDDDDTKNDRTTRNNDDDDDDDDSRDGKSPQVAGPYQIFPGCHGAIQLPPNFTSTMFNIFHSSQTNSPNDDDDAVSITATSVNNDAATEIVSNIDHSIVSWERKIDTLEREIATLKAIIKADSVTILNLKTELSEYQEKECLLSLHQDMISEQGSELSAQQMKEYEETIQHLHDEIEVLTSKATKQDKAVNNEVQLQLQNELFAAQIIESESEVRQSRSMMSQITEENLKLSLELTALRAQPVPQINHIDDIDGNEKSDTIGLVAEIVHIKCWMKDVEKKLESGFYCRCGQNIGNSKNIIVDDNALNPTNCVPLLDGEFDDDDDQMDERQTNDESNNLDVEVMLDGTIITTDTAMETTQITEDTQQLPSQPMPQGKVGANEPGVTETTCNFCECLRAQSTPTITD